MIKIYLPIVHTKIPMTMMRRAIVLCRNAVTYADLRMYLNFIVTSAAQIFLLFYMYSIQNKGPFKTHYKSSGYIICVNL